MKTFLINKRNIDSIDYCYIVNHLYHSHYFDNGETMKNIEDAWEVYENDCYLLGIPHNSKFNMIQYLIEQANINKKYIEIINIK